MTKETKQDVFDILLKEHCKTILDLNPASAETDVKQIVENVFRDHYAAASPCKLPVIPKSVGEYIKWGKTYGIPTYMMFSFKFVRGQGFSKLTDEVEDWIISNSDAFATALLLGDWEVEDEPV
jgi:hypothetical protein